MELPTGDYESGGEVVGAVGERTGDGGVTGGGGEGDVEAVEEEKERCAIERRQAVGRVR